MSPEDSPELLARDSVQGRYGNRFGNGGVDEKGAPDDIEQVATPSGAERIVAALLRSKHRGLVTTLAFVSVPIALAAVGVVWFWVVPKIYRWGFSPPSWRGILAAVALFFVPLLVLVLPYGAISLAAAVLNRLAEEQDDQGLGRMQSISERQRALEEEIAERDPDQLIPIIRYSRSELEKFYEISLSQTRRSFRYSVVAMWLGFTLMSGGLILAFAWDALGLSAPPTNINFVVIGAGALIEFVSALFLWIYRSSIAGFTYFYNRQMHTHNVLLCARIAGEMKDGDATRNLIVDKVLAATWAVEGPGAPPGAKGLGNLVAR